MNRRAWCAVLLVIALAGLMALVARRPAPLRRYVSPPLGDGSRYTFLYPASARLMAEGQGRVVLFEGRDWGRNAFIQFLLRNGLLPRGPHRLISVDTNTWNRGDRSFRRLSRTPPSFHPPHGAAISLFVDRAEVYDAHFPRSCWLTDTVSAPPPGPSAENALIRDSFRILASGEIPMPDSG